MYKWKIRFLECDKAGGYWSDNKYEAIVYADSKSEAIQKALKAFECEHYRDLTAEAEEVLSSNDKEIMSSDRALKLIQALVDSTLEEKGLRRGLEFLFNIGFTGGELIDLNCGADNVIDVQGEHREREKGDYTE